MPLQIEHWPLDRLIPYARNPRRNDEVVDRMVIRAIHGPHPSGA